MRIAKRSELLFIYDLAWANPNGDPLDSNKPRIDVETGVNFVTDVRLKRTIRDELISRGYEVLVRDTYTEEGSLADGKHRAMDFMPEGVTKATKRLSPDQIRQLNENVLKKCIDVRLFGCTLPFDMSSKEQEQEKEKEKGKSSGSVTYTGPVQFKMGYSLHPVKCEFIKGTGAFASSDNKDQKTFRQEYVLLYSLIIFYGIVNNRAAKLTGLTEDEVGLMLDATWSGTKNLISRTKAGQIPRLLIRVVYKDDDYYIGELDKYVSFEYEGKGECVRDIKDGKLKLSRLAEKISSCADKVEEVQIKIDGRVPVDVDFASELGKKGIKVVNL